MTFGLAKSGGMHTVWKCGLKRAPFPFQVRILRSAAGCKAQNVHEGFVVYASTKTSSMNAADQQGFDEQLGFRHSWHAELSPNKEQRHNITLQW